MIIVESFFVFITGLMVGSFLNVMALRLLREEDFVFERSKCLKCGEKIAWYDNIPLLSYLLLMGKCRHCGKHISIQYPIVELSTALMFLFIYLNWGFSLQTLFLIFLSANLIVITLTDLREKVIYDINSIPIIPLGLVYNFFNIGAEDMFVSAVIGAVAGAAFFEIFSKLGHLLAGEYAFGGGDTLLGAAFGAWFGWKLLIAILFISLLVQVIVGVPIIFYNMYKKREHKSIAAMVGLFIALAASFSVKYIAVKAELLLVLAVVLVIFSVAGVCIYTIFKRMREAQNHTFLPFGPPMVAAAFIVMFMGDPILQYLPYQHVFGSL